MNKLLLLTLILTVLTTATHALVCPETNTQGLVSTVCRKCNPTTELLDKQTGTCKKKYL